MPRPQQNFIAAIADALKACAWACFTMHLVGGTHEHRFASRALVGAEQVMGENFRSARMKRWMIMSCNEHTRSHQVIPPREAMKIS
ncbi:hypothetical protein FQZ97_1207780 [compost metagenome]